jgi:transcriptional regulator with XRE-family HTH domain
MAKLNLGRLLRAKGMTQTALADAVGVQKGFMSEIVSGKKDPSLETLQKIIAVLQVDPSEAFADDDQLMPMKTAVINDARRGFREDEAKPFAGPMPATITGPNGTTLIPYQISTHLPAISLRAGDILLVDLKKQPVDDDLILVGLTDKDGFQPTTLVRRYRAPWAISLDPDHEDPLINLDTSNRAAWRGTIRSMIREKV